MVTLGVLYDSGRGVSRDTNEALRLFRKAGEKGIAAGDFYVGLHYERAKDFEKSVSYYAQAAQKGDPAAMHNLAVAYDKGRGADQNRRLAAEWMLKAIRLGSVFSVKQMTDNPEAYSQEFRRQLQRQMADAGAYDGAIDGRFGPGTKSAIEALAKRAGQPR
jgi:hypothetical protein